jgi:hypothetical protein
MKLDKINFCRKSHRKPEGKGKDRFLLQDESHGMKSGPYREKQRNQPRKNGMASF